MRRAPWEVEAVKRFVRLSRVEQMAELRARRGEGQARRRRAGQVEGSGPEVGGVCAAHPVGAGRLGRADTERGGGGEGEEFN